MDAQLDQAAAVLDGAETILFFTGAGISTESGIPDFRGPNGIWTKVDPAEFTIDRYLSSAETRRRSWAMWSSSPMRHAEPNQAHRAIVDLYEQGLVLGCVTQNIDGLQQAAGMPESAVVEVHGNAKRTRCLECDASWPTEEVFARVDAGDEDPHCPECGGLIKMTVISFGELMPQAAMMKAYAMAETADAVVAVGTTLGVYPAAEVPLVAARRGVPFVIVNLGPTEQDHNATVRVEGPAGQALIGLRRRLVRAVS